MDTAEEKEKFIRDTLGEDSFLRDKNGNLGLSVEAAAKLGIETDKPIIIDEPFATMGDIGDLRGIAPAALAATAAAPFTGGGSFGALLASMGITGIAGAAGKAIDEVADHVRGDNTQSLNEVATDVAVEGGLAAAGEGIFRGILAPLGRKILSPNEGIVRDGAKEFIK